MSNLVKLIFYILPIHIPSKFINHIHLNQNKKGNNVYVVCLVYVYKIIEN